MPRAKAKPEQQITRLQAELEVTKAERKTLAKKVAKFDRGFFKLAGKLHKLSLQANADVAAAKEWEEENSTDPPQDFFSRFIFS